MRQRHIEYTETAVVIDDFLVYYVINNDSAAMQQYRGEDNEHNETIGKSMLFIWISQSSKRINIIRLYNRSKQMYATIQETIRRTKMTHLLKTLKSVWTRKETTEAVEKWAKVEYGNDWLYAYDHMITTGKIPIRGEY